MPKKMKRIASESSDDEAPEAVSFGSSKKVAKGERDAVQQYHALEKQKKREKNRAIDRALKERSAKGKGKGKARDTVESVASSEAVGSDEDVGEGGSSRRDLEARMARAMMEAEDEDDEDEDAEGSDFEGFSGGEDVEMEGGEDGSEEDEDDMLDEEDQFDEEDEEEAADEDNDDEMGSGSEEAESTAKLSTSAKRNYLPDHLFKSALSGAPSKSSKIVFDDTSRPSPPPSKQQKRKRRKQSSKDIILGSRTIRTLPKPNAITSSVVAKGLSRPRRVEKFARTSLNLKGDSLKSRTKGWTRKSANLGVMKRNGPAANFVRDV